MEVGLLLLVGGLAAGAFGSLLGLGGGILIVPLLTLAFGLPLRDAVGVSLVCVIVTSSASTSVFLERRQVNLRLGMVLELFTAIGAVIGGAIAFLVDERLLAALFAGLLAYVAISMLRGPRDAVERTSVEDGSAPALEPPDRGTDLHVATPAPAEVAGAGFIAGLGGPDYGIRRLGSGAAGSVGAGVVSALLGIGGGLVKVPLMHLLMGVPLRVATATSNLMVGITASVSAIVYLLRGSVDAYTTGPTAVGVFVGATLGSRLGHRVDLRVLRWLFAAVLIYTAFAMGRRALGLA